MRVLMRVHVARPVFPCKSAPLTASVLRGYTLRLPRSSNCSSCAAASAEGSVVTAPSEALERENIQSSSARSGDSTNIPRAPQLALKMGAKVIPHPAKVDYGGEDAYFISSVGGGAFGVADGVGGWQESGINPAEYSRTFMRLACAYLEGRDVGPVMPNALADLTSFEDPPAESPRSDESAASPQGDAEAGPGPESVAADSSSGEGGAEAVPAQELQRLSARGALAAAHAGTRLPGSSTACVLQLNRAARTICAANLGDSGFLLVRDGRPFFKSPALQHHFDCPYQFGACPEFTGATDYAEDAASFELPVQPGDILVAGTDGLWDNVPEADVLPLLPDAEEGALQSAGAIAALAAQRGVDPEYESPYSQEALRQGMDLPWWQKLSGASLRDGRLEFDSLRGGKVDDVTVLVAVVVEEEQASEPAPQPAALDTSGSLAGTDS